MRRDCHCAPPRQINSTSWWRNKTRPRPSNLWMHLGSVFCVVTLAKSSCSAQCAWLQRWSGEIIFGGELAVMYDWRKNEQFLKKDSELSKQFSIWWVESWDYVRLVGGRFEWINVDCRDQTKAAWSASLVRQSNLRVTNLRTQVSRNIFARHIGIDLEWWSVPRMDECVECIFLRISCFLFSRKSTYAESKRRQPIPDKIWIMVCQLKCLIKISTHNWYWEIAAPNNFSVNNQYLFHSIPRCYPPPPPGGSLFHIDEVKMWNLPSTSNTLHLSRSQGGRITRYRNLVLCHRIHLSTIELGE